MSVANARGKEMIFVVAVVVAIIAFGSVSRGRGHLGYIDHTGKMAIKTRFVENAHSFSEGLAAFQAGINYTSGQSK